MWGLALQFVFAIIILRTSVGRAVFSFLGSRIEEFMENADAGSKFVFGDAYMHHYMAFKV